jgi:hypothetical protein
MHLDYRKQISNIYMSSTPYDTFEEVVRAYNKWPKTTEFRIVTGGIGDFIAMDYLYKFSRRYNLIFLTASGKNMRDLLIQYGYPKKYYALYFNWKSFGKPGFQDTEEVVRNYSEMLQLVGVKYIHISDYFNPMLKITSSINTSFLYYRIISSTNPEWISEFNLPDNIAFIAPYTEDISVNCINCKRRHTSSYMCNYGRNFTIQDYMDTCAILKGRGLIGVIVSCEKINIPEEFQNMFINLSTQTTLSQCIEILKRSKCYIGVDTCFSVIASKVFRDPRNIFIKSINVGLYKYSANYYFPHKFLNINLGI